MRATANNNSRSRNRARTGLNIDTSLALASREPLQEPQPEPVLLAPAAGDPDEPESDSGGSDSDAERDPNKPRPLPPFTKSGTGTQEPSLDRQALTVPSNPPLDHTHESFLDSPTPVEVDMAEMPSSRAQRDSHDLSLSPRNVTRDSLVTNMLLSLDKFSMGQLGDKYSHSNSYDDPPQFATPDHTRTWNNSSNAGRPNGHQYSYSSDLEAADDSSRMSSQHSRGRRSNSSSNFQSFTRLNSVREAVHRGQTQTGASRGMHSRGGKGSKSSSTTSVDAGYAQVLGSQRWARGFGRSASFDYGPQQQPQPPVAEPPFRVEFSSNFLADEYDAAPNPTVPGGPRREPPASNPSIPPAAAIPPPPPPSQPAQAQAIERKRSTSRSLKSSAGRKTANTRVDAVPVMPALDLDSAPAPHVGYEKTKEAVHIVQTPGNTPAPPKERAGFFRKFFGSSRSSHNNNNNNNNNHDSTQNSNTNDADRTTNNKTHANGSNPPSRDTSSSHSHHPVLQKKSSSFFRRRKKSVNEEPPPLPTNLPIPPVPRVEPINVPVDMDKVVVKPQPSPVSSLRQVMNPYLRSAPGAPNGLAGQGPSPLADVSNNSPPVGDCTPERSEYKRGFSPEYEPSPDARIRAVRSDSDDNLHRRNDSPSRRPSDRPNRAVTTRNNSFLDLDGASDNDDNQASPSARKSKAKAIDTVSPDKDSPRGYKGAKDDTIRAKKPFQRLEQPDSDDDLNRSTLALPIEGARAPSPASVSTGTDYKSALSAPPSVRIESTHEVSPKVLGTFESMKTKSLDEPEFVVGDPTEDDRQKAKKIYDGNEDFIQKEKAAAWMGEEGPVRQRTLQAYMELYDFTSLSIVHALRQVCCRLVFRAETQQVDRILVAFSKRWCDCNPNHGFKATDVIHTICYSIMLLNTDLHVADIESKMTRSQFIKNTMTTITQAVAESAPDAFSRPSILPEKNPMLGSEPPKTSGEHDRRSFRNSFRPPPRADSGTLGETDDDCGPLVRSRFNGSKKAWEEQIEVVLKGIYTSIRDERLPLFGAESERNLGVPASQGGLSVMGMLKRSPSVLSKAPSESQLSMRGRISENGRNGTARWASKSRSRPGMGRTGFSSSRTSFDDGNSIWSPALSSATWSRYSLGRTQTSISQDSFGSAMPRGDYQQSIGFANALSQAIIRDEDAYGHEAGAPSILSADIPATQLLEDESLELAGPPWVKEGIVIHKHHLDGSDKKAKDRHWAEVFAVVQKGQMSLFSFSSTKSARQKSRTRNAGPHAPVGGGNWQDNATTVGTFSLRQTLASALPPPGYSRSRPHVWALSLPCGAVHLFQVGTQELIKEFVSTVNYWSARLSTHPLVGGISNIEYGWSEAIVNNALVIAINETTTATIPAKASRPSSSAAPGRRSSVNSGSFRGSSFDQVAGAFTHNSGRGKLPGDRVFIAEWAPPTQSMRPSNSTEAEQLEALDTYVKGIEAELQDHNQLRSPMLLAFSPRGANSAKAMANWERKSAYLLREIVKFRTYVDTLQSADTRKQEIYRERDLAQRAARGELSDGDMDISGSDEGDETLRP